MEKIKLISIFIITFLTFNSCADISRIAQDIPVEVVEPPILPPPGVEFGSLSIWIKKPVSNNIIITKLSEKIEIEGQVKYKQQDTLNLTLEINDNIDFASNKVYYMNFANSKVYNIKPGKIIFKEGEAIIQEFTINNISIPFLPAFVRIKAQQGKNVFYSAPCLIYHLRTQGKYNSEQLKGALLPIVLQTDEDIWLETSDNLEKTANLIGSLESGFSWAKLLLTPSKWSTGLRRKVKLYLSSIQTRKNQILANNLHDKLIRISTIMNTAQASESVKEQLSEATLIQAASNAMAEYRVEIIKKIALELNDIEMVIACDATLEDINNFQENFLRALEYSIKNHTLDNLSNAISFYELYGLLSKGTKFFDNPALIKVGGFMFGFEQGMKIGSVASGKIFENPFVALQIAELMQIYMINKIIDMPLSNEDKIDIIEIYRLYLYTLFFTSLSSSEILEGELLWEIGDIIYNTLTNFGKESKLTKSREELRKLAENFKLELRSYDPPIEDLDEKLIQIKKIFQ